MIPFAEVVDALGSVRTSETVPGTQTTVAFTFRSTLLTVTCPAAVASGAGAAPKNDTCLVDP